jgi:hypothetical protein
MELLFPFVPAFFIKITNTETIKYLLSNSIKECKNLKILLKLS